MKTIMCGADSYEPNANRERSKARNKVRLLPPISVERAIFVAVSGFPDVLRESTAKRRYAKLFALQFLFVVASLGDDTRAGRRIVYTANTYVYRLQASAEHKRT